LKGVYDFLMYIEHYLFLRLKEWFLMNILGYKRVKDWKSKGGKPYRPVIFPLHEKHIKSVWSESLEHNVADEYDSMLATYSFKELIGLVRTKSTIQATCLKLHYGRQMTTREIAEKLCIPENTVKSHLRRARQWLRSNA
jgi:DNA-directed RNA polymerase specialized sigma24 family protein